MTDKIGDENVFASAEVRQLSELAGRIQLAKQQESLYQLLLTSIKILSHIKPDSFDNASSFVNQVLGPLLMHICQLQCQGWSRQNPNLKRIISEVVKTGIITIIQIFSYHKRDFAGLNIITNIRKAKQNSYKAKEGLNWNKNRFVNHDINDDKHLLQYTVELDQIMINQLMKYPKVIWGMPLQDISNLLQILRSFQNQSHLQQQINSLVDLYFTQINAYFLSCRPELLEQVTKQSMLPICQKLSLLFKKKQDRIQVYFMLLNTALALIKSCISNQKIQGIRILNKITYQTYFQPNPKISEARCIDWLQKNDVYAAILTPDITEVMLDEGQDLLKFLNKTKTNYELTSFMIELLNSHIETNKHLFAYCLKQIDPFYLSFESRQLVYRHFATLPDYINLNYEYIQILVELPLKCSQYPAFYEQLFGLNLNILQQVFLKWPQVKIRLLTEGIKKLLKYLRMQHLPHKSIESKVAFLKNLILRLFQQVSYFSIYWFRFFFLQQQLGKVVSNNPFQSILAELIEKHSFYDKIFSFMQTLDEDSSADQLKINESIEVARFVIRKANSRQDIDHKHLPLMLKYSDIYKEILNVCGYSNGSARFKQIFTLITTLKQFPFSLYRLAFISVNDQSFEQLQNSDDTQHGQYRLKISPQQLQYYKQTIDLLMGTEQEELRGNLSEFVVSLYIYHSYNKIKNGEEELIKFMTQLLDDFIVETTTFNNQASNRIKLLAVLELLNQTLYATDVLGVGQRRPHCALVSTTSFSLTINNNVTFGNDVAKQVRRNFASNMTLFEVLTVIGLEFKCGPQQMVLRQGKRKLTKRMNGKTLEQLKFINEEQIFAQKNPSNRLQTPMIIKDHEMTQIVRKAVTQIFNRFCYDGKMGLIEVTNLIRQLLGVDCLSNDSRVRRLFQDYDADHDGILLLPDLMNYFYKNLDTSTYYRQNTLKGLQNLRYRKNLTLYDEPLDINLHSYLMLRYRMESPQYHRALFGLSSSSDECIAKKSQQLLLYLPTDKQMRKQMQSIEISVEQSEFIRHYQLIVIQSELNMDNPDCQDHAILQSKRQKIGRFMQQHKEQIIFNLLSMYEQKTPKTEMETKSFIICLKILRNLIPIDNLLHINILQFQFDTNSFPKLPNTSFFAKETREALQTNNFVNFQTALVLQLTQQSIEFEQILAGCFDHERQIRRISCNFIYIWQVKTQWKNNLFHLQIPQNNSEEWFTLLLGIIKNSQTIDYDSILDNTIKVLADRREDFNNREDKLMNGYLNILYGIVLKKQIKNQENIDHLLTKLLDFTISPLNRSILYEIYNQVNPEKLLKYFEETLTTVLPSQQCQIRQRYSGLRNLGSTCYMNSILQQFFMIDKFKQLVLSRELADSYKTIQVSGKQSIDDFMYQLQRMYYHLQYSQKKYYVPREFCLTCKDYEGKPINTSIQEDSHEFLNRLVENAENSFKQDGKLSELQKIICAKTLTEIECALCKNRIEKVETAYSLMLEVKNHSSLEQSLRKFIQKQQISDYFCEQCNKKVKTINKRTYLHELPEIVIFNLQRIIYDPQRAQKIKVHSSMTFPHELNMQEYMKRSDLELTNTNYRLKGVVVHTGTSEGGHYFSIIRTKDKWYKFNDQNATIFDVNDLPREAFGGFESKDGWAEVNYSTNAYILFYERTDVLQPQGIDHQNIFRAEIDKQNLGMIKQLQVHQQCFFRAIDNLYVRNRKSIVSQKIESSLFYDGPYQKETLIRLTELLGVMKKSLLFLNVFSGVKYEAKLKIGSDINELYYYLPEETLFYFSDFNLQNFVESTLVNSDVHYRSITADIFTRNMLIYLQYYHVDLKSESEQADIIKNILSELLSLLNHNELYSNFNKSTQFFTLWKDLIKSDESLKRFLIDNNLLFRMLDLLMGRQSPYAKYHPKSQELPNTLVPVILQIITQSIELKKNIAGASPTAACVYETTPLEAKILMEINLYKRIQKLKYDSPLLSLIIAHYSFNDLHYSMLIADFFLFYLNETDKIDNLIYFFDHLKVFLGIDDELQHHRLTWLLGVPQFKPVKNYGYCLNYSERSEYTVYVSGLYFNKSDRPPRLPILQLLFQNCRKASHSQVMCLGVVLYLILNYDSAFNFITKIRPPNYLLKTYLDWIPDYLSFLLNDDYFIIANKEMFIDQLNTVYLGVREKIETVASTFPVQKYIVGKDCNVKQQGKYEQQGVYRLQLKIHTTYVLDNLPELHHNASMQRKYFNSHDPRGIAHCFIAYRSKMDCQSEGKNLLTKPTVYELSGKTERKLKINLKIPNFNYTIILQQGFLQLNFPFVEGHLQDMLEIEIFNSRQIEVSSQLIREVLMQKEQEKGEDKMKQDGNKTGMMAEDREGKIECPNCTYLNNIDMEQCEVCNQYLFN